MNKAVLTIMAIVFSMSVSNVQAEIIWDSGHHEFSEGYESEVWMSNGATANITGGEIGGLELYETSSVFVYEPSEIHLLRPADSSTANVYGGTIYQLFSLGTSTTYVYGGSFNWLDAVDSSTVNLFVDNYVLDPTGGDFGDGLLSGTWLYGGSFSISLTEDTFDHLNFIPEPSTIMFFSFGSLILGINRRKRKEQ